MLIPAHVRRQKQRHRSRRWSRDRGLGRKVDESEAKDSVGCCEECTDTTCRSKLMDIEEHYSMSSDDGKTPSEPASSESRYSDTSYRKENTKIAPSYDEKSRRLDEVSSEVSDDRTESIRQSVCGDGEDGGNKRSIDSTVSRFITAEKDLEDSMKRGDVYTLPKFPAAPEDSLPKIQDDMNSMLLDDCIDILSDYAPAEKKMRPLEQSIDKMHTLSKIPANECKAYPQQRCIECKKRGIRKDSRYFCEACPMKPAFCKSCFNSTHM